MPKRVPSFAERAAMGGRARADKLSAEALTAISEKGNRARTRKLSPARRAEIARLAAMARWAARKAS